MAGTRILVASICVLGLGMQACTRAQTSEGVGPTAAHEVREAVHLSTGERDLVLAEMRQMLESTEGVVAGLAANDMAAIERAASQSGVQARGTVDHDLDSQLPETFLHLGLAAHGGFDEISELARGRADATAITARLGETLRQCTGCHAAYRVEVHVD